MTIAIKSSNVATNQQQIHIQEFNPRMAHFLEKTNAAVEAVRQFLLMTTVDRLVQSASLPSDHGILGPYLMSVV
jgi:hypothetical protein